MSSAITRSVDSLILLLFCFVVSSSYCKMKWPSELEHNQSYWVLGTNWMLSQSALVRQPSPLPFALVCLPFFFLLSSVRSLRVSFLSVFITGDKNMSGFLAACVTHWKQRIHPKGNFTRRVNRVLTVIRCASIVVHILTQLEMMNNFTHFSHSLDCDKHTYWKRFQLRHLNGFGNAYVHCFCVIQPTQTFWDMMEFKSDWNNWDNFQGNWVKFFTLWSFLLKYNCI